MPLPRQRVAWRPRAAKKGLLLWAGLLGGVACSSPEPPVNEAVRVGKSTQAAPATAGPHANESAAPHAVVGSALEPPDPDDDPVGALLHELQFPSPGWREQLGPHTLRWSLQLKVGEPGDDPLPRPREREAVALRMGVQDSLEVRWRGPMEFEIRQETRPLDKRSPHPEQSRSLRRIGEREFTMREGKGWFERAMESDEAELWLDEAYAAPGELLRMASPRLALDPAPRFPPGPEGEKVNLTRSSERTNRHIPDTPQSEWRFGAEIDQVEGWLERDAEGRWRALELELGWRFQGKDGGTRQAWARLEGKLSPDPKLAKIEAPEGSQPLPERTRLIPEAAKLLDGLAAP